MASGIPTDPSCATILQDFKMGNMYRYLVLGIEPDPNNRRVVVTKTVESGTYQDALKELLERQCLWVVYRAQVQIEGQGKAEKLIMISWAPDSAPILQKVTHSTTQAALLSNLGFTPSAIIQATELAEVDQAEVGKKLRGTFV